MLPNTASNYHAVNAKLVLNLSKKLKLKISITFYPCVIQKKGDQIWNQNVKIYLKHLLEMRNQKSCWPVLLINVIEYNDINIFEIVIEKKLNLIEQNELHIWNQHIKLIQKQLKNIRPHKWRRPVLSKL